MRWRLESSRLNWAPWLVLFIGLASSFYVTHLLFNLSDLQDRERFVHNVKQTQNAINSRLENYITLLRGTAGFLTANKNATEQDFHQFVKRLHLSQRYQGIQGIGFSKRIPPRNLESFVQEQKQKGRSNFRVWPEHERSEYHTILYLEPLDKRNQAAIGYDMFSEPIRREAMERARNTGYASASAPVRLVQEIDEEVQPGFLIYLPVYDDIELSPSEEERREKLIGFAYSPFRIYDLFESIFSKEFKPQVDFTIFNGTSQNPEDIIYRSFVPGEQAYKPRFHLSRSIRLAGLNWNLDYTPNPNFEYGSSQHIVPFVLLFGALMTLILTGITHAQIKARREAEYSAEQLQKSQGELRAFNETLEQRIHLRTQDLVHRARQLRLMASELTLAEQRERRHLAAELHDYLAQILVVCKMKLSRLNTQKDTDKFTKSIAELDDLVNQSLKYTRNLIAELSPSILYESGLLDAIHWLARQMQQQHGLHVRIQHPAKQLDLRDDEKVLLFQSIREVLFNIVKHAQVKEASIDIQFNDANQELMIQIQDHGVGFDVHSIRQGSDPAHQFGLMSISERLEALGGTIAIDSAKGRGTTVTMKIAVRKEEPKEMIVTTKQPEFIPSVMAGNTNGNVLHVLVADDHDMVREGICHIIDSCAGLQVIGRASDGEEAVHLTRVLSPDAVVMDLNMPKMNGIEATRIISQEMPSVQVIGVSVHDEKNMAGAMKDAGAVSYLIKGASPDELCRVLLNMREAKKAGKI